MQMFENNMDYAECCLLLFCLRYNWNIFGEFAFNVNLTLG